ncbi:MAG: hypothetical protein HY784_05640 [Chloroflexi bacterium]|nr:hypothetical protein [Chloroflexota bacterium]
MSYAKPLADLITLARAALAFVLAWLGVAQGAGGLPAAVWLMIADWTGDVLDGTLARRSRRRYRSWIGEHDLEVDMLVALGLLAYMAAARLLDPRLAGLYLLLWALYFLRQGLVKSPGMLFQAPIYGWFLLFTLFRAPGLGLWLVAWIAAAIALTWPRFPDRIVPEFLAGMRAARDARRKTG